MFYFLIHHSQRILWTTFIPMFCQTSHLGEPRPAVFTFERFVASVDVEVFLQSGLAPHDFKTIRTFSLFLQFLK